MIPKTALVYLLIFITGCWSIFFIDASYGVLLYVLNYFFHPPGRSWGRSLPDLRYAFSIAALTVASFLMRHKRYSENRILAIPQFKWLVLLGIIMIATFPVAVDHTEHEKFLIVFIKYVFLYYIMVKTIDTPTKFNKLMGIFLAGQFYLGWIIYEGGRTSDGRVERMGTADAKNANGLAAVLVVATPFLIHYLITGKKWQKVCSLVALVFILNAVILINSRGAFLAVLISVLYYFFLTLKAPSFPKFNKSKIFAAVIVGFALFLYLADPVFWDRMSTITSPSESEEVYSGRERMDYWMKSFEVLKDHPFGVGAMGFEAVSPIYLPDSLSSSSGTRAVHSTYFQALSEYGYHGFLIFMIFLVSNIRYLWRTKRFLLQKKAYDAYYLSIAIEAGFIAHLIAAAFINRLYSEILYWSSAFIACYGNIYLNRMEFSGKDEVDVASGQ